MKTRRNSPQHAFSLIELLVVMVIILVAVVLMFGNSSRSHQQRQIAACQKNLQNIQIAMMLYGNDNNGVYPTLTGAESSEGPLSQLVPRSTVATEMFTCPGTGDDPQPQGKPFADGNISYAYYMGLNANTPGDQALITDSQVNTESKKQGEQIFSADGEGPGANHHKFGGNLLFVDGSVRTSETNAEMAVTIPQNAYLLNPKKQTRIKSRLKKKLTQ